MEGNVMRLVQSQMAYWFFRVILLGIWGMGALTGLAQDPPRIGFSLRLSPPQEPPLSEFRTLRSWVEADGQRKIQAHLQSVDEKEVVLLGADGESERWPLGRLSRANRDFVQHYQDLTTHFQSAFGNRLQFLSPGIEPAETPFNPPGENIPVPQAMPTVQDFQILPIHAVAPTWEVGPLLPEPNLEAREVILPIRLSKHFFDNLSILAAGESPTVVVSSAADSIHHPKSRGKFVVLNLADESSSPVQGFAEPWQLIALSPTGDRCAAVRRAWIERGSELAIFEVTQAGVRPLYSFQPGPDREHRNNLKWVSFLPHNRLATHTEDNVITIWDLGHTNEAGQPSPKALFREISLTSAVAVSPRGELLAIYANGSRQISMIRGSDSRLLGTLTLDKIPERLAFSPDGKFLAVLFPRLVVLYRMADGKEEKRFPITPDQLLFGAKFEWVGRHLMIAQDLYDLELEFPIWTYESDAFIQFIKPQALLGGMAFHVLGKETHSTVVVTPIPHPEALATAAQVDPQDLTIHLQPGDGIRVSLAIDEAPYQLKREIELWVEDLLKQTGWVRSDDAEAVLEILVQKGELVEQLYYPRSGPIPDDLDRVSFHSWRQQLQIKKGEHLLYHQELETSFPKKIELKQGESVQAAVVRMTQPDFMLYQILEIPHHLRQRNFLKPLGHSIVTPVGLWQRPKPGTEGEPAPALPAKMHPRSPENDNFEVPLSSSPALSVP